VKFAQSQKSDGSENNAGEAALSRARSETSALLVSTIADRRFHRDQPSATVFGAQPR
jgi:hypothetical protein